jgi:predicted ATPase
VLRRIYVDNFRCLVNFEFKPDTVNLLLGRNGSGKSTLFDAMKAIEKILFGHSLVSTLGPDSLPWWDTRKTQRFELEFSEGGSLFTYRLCVRQTPRETPTITEERLVVDKVEQISLLDGLLTIPGVQKPIPFEGKQSALATGLATTSSTARFLGLVRRMLVFRLNPWAFELDARDENARLNVDGGNLVAFLKSWSQADPESFVEWKRRALRALPHLDDLQLRELVAGSRMLVGTKHLEGKELLLGLASFSEGERVRLALQVIAGLGGQATCIGLDEPDNFLAPSEVQPILRAFTVDTPRTPAPQMMIVTHHPESIDYLATYSTWLFERTDEGLSRVRRLEFDRAEGERATDALLSVLS